MRLPTTPRCRVLGSADAARVTPAADAVVPAGCVRAKPRAAALALCVLVCRVDALLRERAGLAATRCTVDAAVKPMRLRKVAVRAAEAVAVLPVATAPLRRIAPVDVSNGVDDPRLLVAAAGTLLIVE